MTPESPLNTPDDRLSRAAEVAATACLRESIGDEQDPQNFPTAMYFKRLATEMILDSLGLDKLLAVVDAARRQTANHIKLPYGNSNKPQLCTCNLCRLLAALPDWTNK